MTSMSSMVEVESSIGTMVINESSDDAESTFDEDDGDDDDVDGERRRQNNVDNEKQRERRKKKKDDKDKTKYRPPFLDHFDRAREKEILIDRHLQAQGGGIDRSDTVGVAAAGVGLDNGANFTLNSLNTPSFEELLRLKGESMEQRFMDGVITTTAASNSSSSNNATVNNEVDFNTASSINSSGTFVRHHEGDTPIPSPAGTFVQHDDVPAAPPPPIGAFRHLHKGVVGYDESSFDPTGWTPVGPRLGDGTSMYHHQQHPYSSATPSSAAASTTAANSFYYNDGSSSMQLGSSALTHPSGPMNKLSSSSQQQQQQQHRGPVSRCDVVDGPPEGGGGDGSGGSDGVPKWRIDHDWTFQKIMQGDFDFLSESPYEELQQRLNLVDRECESELELLKRRYQNKRLPILSAIDAKRKRQQNF